MAVRWSASVASSHVTRRLPLSPLLVVLPALTGLLAGCEHEPGSATSAATSTAASSTAASSTVTSTAGSAATSTATSAPATTSSTECPAEIADNTYVRAESAHVQGDSVVVTADPARRVCTGPNNGHYEIGTGTEQLTVPASATVTVLTTTSTGLGHETVAPTDLPARLPDDRFGRIFLVDGPSSAVTSLEEQYHP
jgi:hypothetical protein